MSSFLLLLLGVLSIVVIPPGMAQDKPVSHADDARRAALLKAGYTAVSLTYDPKNLNFFVGGAIESEKVKFQLDRGARETAIDLKAAKTLKLELGAETTAPAIGGLSTARQTSFLKMNIGPVDIGKDWAWLDAEVVDLSRRPGSPQAVLGMQILFTRGCRDRLPQPHSVPASAVSVGVAPVFGHMGGDELARGGRGPKA